MDIDHPDPIEAIKKVRYRFIKKDLGFELPDEFEGYPVRVVKV